MYVKLDYSKIIVMTNIKLQNLSNNVYRKNVINKNHLFTYCEASY